MLIYIARFLIGTFKQKAVKTKLDLVYSCQPVQPEFLDNESKFPGFYNIISLDIDISHNKMINSQEK